MLVLLDILSIFIGEMLRIMKVVVFFLVIHCSIVDNLTTAEDGMTLEQLIVKMGEVLKKLDKQNELETKVEQLEKNLRETMKKVRLQSSSYNTSQWTLPVQKSIPRTCDELRKLEPDLPSGQYFIDPDGYGRGESPISVYCNIRTGTTSVGHDSEEATVVRPCRNPGCHSHPVFYQANMKQIVALIQLSSRCRQLIQYKCTKAPLRWNGIDYAWWTDRNGQPRFHWSGSNVTHHICQCGFNEECDDPSLTCHCDSNLPAPVTDRGYLTDKQLLPVSGLHFGHTHDPSSTGEHLLGPLECSGQILLEGMATSCLDLWRVGHTLSGIYSVQRDNGFNSVYCNMAKLPDEQGFERIIGLEDIKTVSIYFHVLSTKPHSSLSFIPYDIESLNIGEAMNISTGLFTAPVNGIYFFLFNGLRDQSSASCWVCLYKNDVRLGCSYSQAGRFETLSTSSTIKLDKNDQIGVKLQDGISFSHPSHPWVQFTGFLIQQHF